ncbi:MAG: antibiotic biosynthesis monooxygenase [SAR324 cluster bacterium]|nr:antibiotic biosynthesis monooxygenase [SAR324 cluster bacterium]
MSVTVVLELQAKPESSDELRATLKAILPDTRAFEGCESIEVVGNQEDACNLIIYEKWTSRAQNEKYMQWRTETGALEKLGAMLAQAPSFRFYDLVDA